MNTVDSKSERIKHTIEGYTPKDIETRVVKNFLDILIIAELKKQGNLSGYEVTTFVNDKFNKMLSPGTVYATVYTLERKGLIEGIMDGRKTVYKLTIDGEQVLTRLGNSLNQQMIAIAQKISSI
jgi:DNA-binding PadR family transcriptional regulator